MMKKITSFLTMLVMLFVSIGASAQEVDATDFENKSVAIGTAVNAITPNTWYVIFNGTRSNEMGAFVKAGEIPGAGGVLYDDNDAIAKKKNITDIKEGDPAKNFLHYFVRLIEANGDGEQNVYQVQFATGKYLASNLYTITNKYDGGKFNIYPISNNTEGLFGFNKYNMAELVNNNGVNGTLAYWKSGEITSTDYEELKTADTYNSVWSIHPVVLTGMDAREAAYKDLVAVVGEYEPLIGNFTTGTLPGQYDADLLEAFKAAIKAVKDLDQSPDVVETMTAEEFQAMAQAIKDAYEALIASKVPYTLADGYYRIKSGMEFYTMETDEITLEETKTYHDKYMISVKNADNTLSGKWGTPEDLSTDATALWKVTNAEEGNFDIVNVGTDARFNNVTTSSAVGMSTTSENLMAIDPAVLLNEVMYVNIRVSTQNANDYFYLHTGGHGGGTGTGGNLVGWSSTATAEAVAGTEWTFLPVSEEEAQAVIDAYAPIKDREVMLQRYDSLLTEAKEKLAIAKDVIHTELTQSADQFTCWETEKTEGSVAALIDNNNSTYWHSTWSTTATGYAYIQVEMPEPVDVFELNIVRRAANANHASKAQIYAGNDANALSLVLSDVELGNATSGAAFETEINLGAAYKFVKFEFTEVASPDKEREFPCIHFAEFHLFLPPQMNENAQARFMDDLVTNLENVINNQAELELDDITINEYNALKDALDAFLTKFTDPTELRQVLKDTKDVAGVVVPGNDPGFWANTNGAAEYTNLYNEAVAYDAMGDYTPEQSADYIERLTSGAKNIYESAIGIKEGKWYRIRFGTEEEFTRYKWDMIAGNGTENGKTEALFGKYVTVCSFTTDEEGYEIHEPIASDEIDVGHALYFDDEMHIYDKEMSEFRFINVGDTAYMLQNRATGLFIKAQGGSGAVSLSAHPTLFNVRAIGYGENVITATNINGDYESNLHAQVSQNVLVTWDVDYPGSRSGLYIEEAGNVDPDFDGSEFNILMADGSIGSWCFPMEVSVESGNAQIWGVNSVDGTNVDLCKLDKAIAGRPFFLVCGDLDGYDPESDDLELVKMKHTYEIGAIEPDNSGYLKGTFKALQIGYGYIVTSGNELVVSKTSSTTIGANGAYIAGEELFDLEASVNANWDEIAEDGLTEVFNKVRNSGAVYTLDGRLVSKKATLTDVGRMPKGIYILNGVKIVIK